MKIMVLGADGYLGWPTCLHLSARGHEVIAVDNYAKRSLTMECGVESLTSCARLVERSVRWERHSGKSIDSYEIDVCDQEDLATMIQSTRPDAIIHYAEQPSGPYSMRGYSEAQFTLENNVGGTLSLIHAVLEVDPGIHIVKLGTMGEYGTPNCDIPEGFFDFEFRGRKERRLFPREAGSWYHSCKILETDMLWFYTRMKKLRVTDLMQGPVYGVLTPEISDSELPTHFNYDEAFGTCLNRFVAQALVGHPLTVYGKGGQTRGYLNLLDTMRCVELAVTNPAKPGELKVMNQFTEDFAALELAELVRAAGKALGMSVEIDHVENPRIEAEDHYYQADNTKLLELGLQPHPLTEDVVAEMITYLRPLRDRIQHSAIMPKTRW